MTTPHNNLPGQMTLTTLENELGVDSTKLKLSVEIVLQEYILNGCNIEAAYRKGYPKSTKQSAVANGSRLLKSEAVQRRIVEIRQELERRYAVDAQAVVRLLSMSMSVDRRKFVNDEGRPLALHELDSEAAAITDVRISIDRHGTKHAIPVVPERRKAAGDLAKILGITREKIVIQGDFSHLSDEQLEAESQRIMARAVKDNPERFRQLLEQG